MILVLLNAVLVSSALSSIVPPSQSLLVNDDGTYQFFYETGDYGGRHSRSESRNLEGVVTGRYAYEDPTGQLREVNYRADDDGYVAKGDVSVDGAPKGQFPAVSEKLREGEADDEAKAPTTEEQSHDSKSTSNEEADEDDAKDLTLEESGQDGPPEAFPQGFFLKQFQGLRRLPEPTAAPLAKQQEGGAQDGADESGKENGGGELGTQNGSKQDAVAGHHPISHFGPPGLHFLRFSPGEWASAVHHHPMHVFAYQQPNSYGYHYSF